jgi:hypothetical protein
MTINLSPTQVVAALGVLLALSMMWRAGGRRGRRAGYGASRVASLAGHVLGTAGVILGIEWVAITYAFGTTLDSGYYWRGDRR